MSITTQPSAEPSDRGATTRPSLMGLPIDNLSMDEAVDKILEILKGDDSRQVCFVNADCVNIAYRDAEYRAAVQSADMVFTDGAGMALAGRILGKPLRDNVNGTDMFPVLCRSLSATDYHVYLLGGKPGVAEDVSRWVDANFPGVRICGAHHGYFEQSDEPGIINEIRDLGIDLLLVALGEPRQTLWTADHLAETRVKVALGVGGLFDFYSGAIPRAPEWLRTVWMEWAYRLAREPGRLWRRYLVGNPLFLSRLIAAWLIKK